MYEGAAFGAMLGFGLIVSTNRMMRVHSWSTPWRHVISTVIAGYIGHNFNKWEMAGLASVNRMREERGLPPRRRSNIEILRKRMEEQHPSS